MDVLVYSANATTKQCEIAKNLTNNTTSTAVARDLALSPDKSTVAFFAGVGPGAPSSNLIDNVTLLTTVPVDGSQPPTAVPGAVGSGDFGIGPRWVAGGTVLTWGVVDLNPLVNGSNNSSNIPVGKLCLHSGRRRYARRGRG